jgi:putative ABC transport system permease protein
MRVAANTLITEMPGPPKRAATKVHIGVKAVPMVTKLAYRNLFHDRLSLVVTLVGIVFSVVLVAVQLGIYLGFQNTIAAMLDHVHGDLWVVSLGTKSFDDPALLSGREKHMVLSTPGVAGVEELAVGFVNWRKPAGGTTIALLVGSHITPSSSLPWDVTQGSPAALLQHDAVAVDNTYFTELGINGIGERAEVNGTVVSVTAVTHGIRSFTTMPYVFATLATARPLLGASPDQSSYAIVQVQPGHSIESVRSALAARMPDTEILTQEEFRARSLDYWLFQTGAGSAIIGGAILGIIVGIVIVAQTLYASTKDHLNEFATLRALGASARYINKVILMQAVLSAGIGYVLGMILSVIIIWASRDSSLLIVMTGKLAVMLFFLTIGMCMLAAVCAIFKVIRIDPAVVFSR